MRSCPQCRRGCARCWLGIEPRTDDWLRCQERSPGMTDRIEINLHSETADGDAGCPAVIVRHTSEASVRIALNGGKVRADADRMLLHAASEAFLKLNQTGEHRTTPVTVHTSSEYLHSAFQQERL